MVVWELAKKRGVGAEVIASMNQDIEAVIPPKTSRRVQRAFDNNLYEDRNKILSLFLANSII